jgi:hypothetical protein
VRDDAVAPATVEGVFSGVIKREDAKARRAAEAEGIGLILICRKSPGVGDPGYSYGRMIGAGLVGCGKKRA